VLVETHAGEGIGADDEAYRRAGAQIAGGAAEVFVQAAMVVKVKEPQPQEWQQLREGQILFTYLHLAPDPEQTSGLLKSGVTGIAYETVTDDKGGLPLLAPMSEVAGRLSIEAAGAALKRYGGGRGLLLGGVPGVQPARVAVLGGGVVGTHAARMAVGLKADVIILEVDGERMRFLDLTMPNVKTLYSNEANLTELMPTTDLLIGAVLVPGAKAPKLVTREMFRKMKPGSVFVDIAIDQGGCAETSRATTHEEPIYVEEEVTHYCVANMPGAYARTSTQALSNATARYAELLADLGLEGACRKVTALTGGINTRDGKITYAAVAEAHGLKYEPPF